MDLLFSPSTRTLSCRSAFLYFACTCVDAHPRRPVCAQAFVGARWRRKLTLEQAAASGARWSVSGIDVHAPSGSAAMEALDELMPGGAERHVTGCWISSVGNDTPTHYDAFGPHNIHLVCSGEKAACIFAPAEAERLYCYGGPRYLTRYAAGVDPSRPDMRRFPKYAEVCGLQATLQAGDALFIPAFWWHHFHHTGAVNLSLTRWFYQPPHAHPQLPRLPARVHLNCPRFLFVEPLCDALVALVRLCMWICLGLPRILWGSRRILWGSAQR